MSNSYSAVRGTDPGLGDRLDRGALDVDQRHVVLVEHLVVVGLQRRALGAVGITLGREQVGDGRVVHAFVDALADVLGDGVVGVLVEQNVLIAVDEQLEPAGIPPLVEGAAPLLGRHRERGGLHLGVGHAEEVVARRVADLGVVGLHGADHIGIRGPVDDRGGVVRRPLEDRQVPCGLRDLGDRLDAAGPGPDDGDPLAGEVDVLVEPVSGEVHLTAERLDTVELGRLGHRQVARPGDHVPGGDGVAELGADPPEAGVVVPHHRVHPGVEQDVLAQVEPVGNVVQVAQDLGLAGEALAPLPVLLQFLGERV